MPQSNQFFDFPLHVRINSELPSNINTKIKWKQFGCTKIDQNRLVTRQREKGKNKEERKRKNLRYLYIYISVNYYKS